MVELFNFGGGGGLKTKEVGLGISRIHLVSTIWTRASLALIPIYAGNCFYYIHLQMIVQFSEIDRHVFLIVDSHFFFFLFFLRLKFKKGGGCRHFEDSFGTTFRHCPSTHSHFTHEAAFCHMWLLKQEIDCAIDRRIFLFDYNLRKGWRVHVENS